METEEYKPAHKASNGKMYVAARTCFKNECVGCAFTGIKIDGLLSETNDCEVAQDSLQHCSAVIFVPQALLDLDRLNKDSWADIEEWILNAIGVDESKRLKNLQIEVSFGFRGHKGRPCSEKIYIRLHARNAETEDSVVDLWVFDNFVFSIQHFIQLLETLTND